MLHRIKQNAGWIAAGVILFASFAGGADAAGVLHIGTANLNNGAVTKVKIHNGAVGTLQLSPYLRSRISAIVSASTGPEGPIATTSATGGSGAPTTITITDTNGQTQTTTCASSSTSTTSTTTPTVTTTTPTTTTTTPTKPPPTGWRQPYESAGAVN